MADINTLPTPDGAGIRIHDKLYKTVPQTEAIGAAATVASFTIKAWALVHTIILTLPNWTNPVTATLSIENSDGDELYSHSGLAENDTHEFAVDVALVGTNTVKITLSGVPGGTGGNTVTTLYLEGK